MIFISVPFVVIPFLAGWIALGLAWAPFAAFISMRKARRLGLNPLKFAALAFVLSLFFIFPWLYLNESLDGTESLELRGESLTDRIVAYAPFVLYACWLLGPIAKLGFLLGATTVVPYTPADEQISELQISELRLTVVVSLMLLAWVGSLIQLRNRGPGQRKQVTPTYLAPDYVRIMPFVYAFLSTIAVYAVPP